jgi:uncharacterized protein
MVVDIHAHAFPDFLAEKALAYLSERSGDYDPQMEGTVSALLASMDEAGVDISCVANIATKPEQAAKILEWSQSISSERIVPLGSVHPKSSQWEKELDDCVRAGISGIKLHPLYQDFVVDDSSIYSFYEAVAAKGLFVLFHAGYDIAFGDADNAKPNRFARIRRDIKDLVFVTAHLGGWHDWDEVCSETAGLDIFMDTSFIHEVDRSVLDRILSKHSRERFVFGSDSPWILQKDSLRDVSALPVDDDFKERIFGGNIMKYLLNKKQR